MTNKDYTHCVAGFGDKPKEAMEDAESRLPAPLKQADFYSRTQIVDPVKVEGDQYKVEIKYDLAKGSPKAGKVKKRSSTAGETDPYACTRDITAQF